MKKYFALGLTALFFMACENTQTTPAGQPLPILPSGEAIEITTEGALPLPSLAVDPAELVDALALYESNCASCHGLSGAGGIGPKISAKGEDYLFKALIGYSQGIYGGSKKATMENVVKGLDSVQLQVLSVYISGL